MAAGRAQGRQGRRVGGEGRLGGGGRGDDGLTRLGYPHLRPDHPIQSDQPINLSPTFEPSLDYNLVGKTLSDNTNQSTSTTTHPTSPSPLIMSESKTGAIPSVAAGGQHQLTEDTLIVVLGASGDLAKKKVRSSPFYEHSYHQPTGWFRFGVCLCCEGGRSWWSSYR